MVEPMTQAVLLEKPTLVYTGTKRPTDRSPEVIAEVVRGVLDDVCEWAKTPEGERDEVAEDLTDAIEHGHASDSYEMCKYLEDRKHWSCDRALVDILDNLDTRQVQREMVRQWVKATNPTPKRSVGDHVSTRHGDGIIARIDAKDATYLVRVPSKGHVDRGEGTHGFLMAYEEIDV
jgi:hypothetical protein